MGVNHLFQWWENTFVQTSLCSSNNHSMVPSHDLSEYCCQAVGSPGKGYSAMSLTRVEKCPLCPGNHWAVLKARTAPTLCTQPFDTQRAGSNFRIVDGAVTERRRLQRKVLQTVVLGGWDHRCLQTIRCAVNSPVLAYCVGGKGKGIRSR